MESLSISSHLALETSLSGWSFSELSAGLVVSLIAGLILLLLQTFAKKALLLADQTGVLWEKFLPFLKTLYSIALGIAIYGFWLRPILSVEVLRDETVEVLAGSGVSFDMNLKNTSRRVVKLEYKVLEGGAVDIYLATMESASSGIAGFNHIPAFAVARSLAGSTSARVESGTWSIVVTPSSTNKFDKTVVEIETSVRRPRFFEKIAATTDMLFKNSDYEGALRRTAVLRVVNQIGYAYARGESISGMVDGAPEKYSVETRRAFADALEATEKLLVSISVVDCPEDFRNQFFKFLKAFSDYSATVGAVVGKDPSEPLYSHVREVSLETSRQLQELGAIAAKYGVNPRLSDDSNLD